MIRSFSKVPLGPKEPPVDELYLLRWINYKAWSDNTSRYRFRKWLVYVAEDMPTWIERRDTRPVRYTNNAETDAVALYNFKACLRELDPDLYFIYQPTGSAIDFKVYSRKTKRFKFGVDFKIGYRRIVGRGTAAIKYYSNNSQIRNGWYFFIVQTERHHRFVLCDLTATHKVPILRASLPYTHRKKLLYNLK